MINVTRSSMPPFEEYCDEIKKIWDSRWLTNNGIEHRTLENELCEKFNVKIPFFLPTVILLLNVRLQAMIFRVEVK